MSENASNTNDKTPEEPSLETAGGVVVMHTPGLFRRPLGRALFVVGIALLVAGVVTGAWLVRGRNVDQPKPAFIVEGTAYSKETIRLLTDYPVKQGIDAETASKQAYEMYRHKAAAVKAGVVISDKELKTTRDALFKNADSTGIAKDWVELASYDEALTQLQNRTQYYSDAIGDIYVFWFAQRIDYNPDQPIDGFGDVGRIAEDKAYAKSQADIYRSSLMASKLTAAQALSGVKADTRLGYGDANNSNPSIRFKTIDNTQASGSALANLDPIIVQKAVSIGAKAGVDEVRTGSIMLDVSNPLNKSGKLETKDAYFYLINIEKPATRSFSISEYTKALEALEAKYEGI